MDSDDKFSDQFLYSLIVDTERKLFQEGHLPKYRHFQVPTEVMLKCGCEGFVVLGSTVPPLLKRIRAIHDKFYRPRDIAIGGTHAGVFVFRGIVASISIPIMFGSVSINPFQLSDLTEFQLQWLCLKASDQEKYLDCFYNIFDLVCALEPVSGAIKPPEITKNFLNSSKFHLQAAAGALIASYDGRGAIQSALLGSELALKSVLKADGITDSELKNIGHSLQECVNRISENHDFLNLPKLKKVIKEFPKLVPNRYSDEQPDLLTTGKIVMDAQFVAAEAARLLTGYSFSEVYQAKVSARLNPK